ncbi:transcription factor bHLH18-like [Olea europaea var. sylvestris]|uniref:Transcription factor bHLH18-like n=1 Tax=Olea europaea subsp. europaea TaxID=158383 RepID=A0A8S0RKR0_OLEEU|nr:transcription factor bHLH18-like [Olea europaea var. sylvestris]CAA2979772.1 transcription factor bHLH18-like [Olea europaea subsp. europaea]
MDEASVLENAIRYFTYLQGQVDLLEEQERKPTVRVKKSQLVVDDDESSWNEQQSPPSIEAQVCDKHVLLRIRCEKRKGVLVKILCEVEKLNLGFVHTCVVPFGSSSYDIIIVAENEEEFSLAVKEIVQNIYAVLQRAV